MTAEFTPTTEQVRDGYATDPEDDYRNPISAPANFRAAERAFDRWLAEHDTEIRTQAEREAQQAYNRGYRDSSRDWQRAGDGMGIA